jgi:hypothetical protein
MPNVTEMRMDLAGKITFELDDGTTKIVDLANLPAGGGGGSVTANDITDAGTSGKDVLRASTVAAIKTVLALVKADVGLGNVDNTSDVNKPVSTAQATAIALKVTKTTIAPGSTLASIITAGKTTDSLNGAEGINGAGGSAIIHSGAIQPFGFGGYGACSFTGDTGVTVVDIRNTGATNPVWAIQPTGANSYNIIGSKA